MWINFNHKLVNLDYIYLITKEYIYREENDQDIFIGRFILLHGINKNGEYGLKENFMYEKYPSSEDAEEACNNRFLEIEMRLTCMKLHVNPLY